MWCWDGSHYNSRVGNLFRGARVGLFSLLFFPVFCFQAIGDFSFCFFHGIFAKAACATGHLAVVHAVGEPDKVAGIITLEDLAQRRDLQREGHPSARAPSRQIYLKPKVWLTRVANSDFETQVTDFHRY